MRRESMWAAALGLAVVTACGSSDGGGAPGDGGAGVSGSGAAGGTSGSAGASGSGGTSGSAGASGSGGTSGSAGASGSGGTSGSAGASGSGGTSGSGGAAGSGGTSGSGGASRWVSGYYVGYQQALYPPSAVDFAALTHLFVGRAVPHADGSVETTLDIDAVNGPKLAKQLTGLAHAAGDKAVLMVGGAGEHAGWVGAAAAANRAAFVANLLSAMTDLGFDGLDLDWEPLDAGDVAAFKALAQALRAAAPGMILTVPVGYVNDNFPDVGTFWASLAPTFDQINVMTYDMAGAWQGWQSWHSSALAGETPTTPTSVDSSVAAYLAAGVPASKLGIGIPFYGTCWQGVTGPMQSISGATVVASDNTMSYTHVMADYFVPSARQWDATANVPYLSFASGHGTNGCNFISYDDEQSIAAKGAYVKQHGLGGAIVWTINEGYLPGAPQGQRNPLLDALHGALN